MHFNENRFPAQYPTHEQRTLANKPMNQKLYKSAVSVSHDDLFYTYTLNNKLLRVSNGKDFPATRLSVFTVCYVLQAHV